MKLLTYRPLLILLFTLSLSSLMSDVSANNEGFSIRMGDEAITVEIPKDVLSGKIDKDDVRLRLTLKKIDVNVPNHPSPTELYVYIGGRIYNVAYPPVSDEWSYYESTIEITENHWYNLNSQNMFNVFLEMWFNEDGDIPSKSPVSLVGASFVNTSITADNTLVKREGQELIVLLPDDDELTGKSLLLTFGKTMHPIRVHSIEIYAAGELIETKGPYTEPYTSENYETMAIPIPEELLKSWSAMKLHEVTVWPVFWYHSTIPNSADPPLANAVIIDTLATDTVDDDIVGQEENYCAKYEIWTPKNCVGGDLDNDGDTDFFIIMDDGFVRYLERDDTGVLIQQEEGWGRSFMVSSPSKYARLHLGDWEGDGDLDLILIKSDNCSNDDYDYDCTLGAHINTGTPSAPFFGFVYSRMTPPKQEPSPADIQQGLQEHCRINGHNERYWPRMDYHRTWTIGRISETITLAVPDDGFTCSYTYLPGEGFTGESREGSIASDDFEILPPLLMSSLTVERLSYYNKINDKEVGRDEMCRPIEELNDLAKSNGNTITAQAVMEVTAGWHRRTSWDIKYWGKLTVTFPNNSQWIGGTNILNFSCSKSFFDVTNLPLYE